MAATITLNDLAKLSNDPLQKGVIMDLLRDSDLLSIVPFQTVNALQVMGVRWGTMPSVGFRKINAGYSASSGTHEQIAETLYMLGGDVQIDKVIAKGPNTFRNPLAEQMAMKAKALAFQFNDSFINGDNGVNPDSFEGVKKRNSNMPSRMTINLASGGDSLKVLASSTTEHTFIDAIHQAKKVVSGATHFLCNETSWLGLGKIARRLNLYQQITDAYGRTWDTIGGVPYIDVGLKSDKSTEIITDTEDPGDGGNDASSIYAVRFDTNDGLSGLTLDGFTMNVYDPLGGKEMETVPAYLRRIDWGLGLWNLSNYCIARIKGFKMAAS